MRTETLEWHTPKEMMPPPNALLILRTLDVETGEEDVITGLWIGTKFLYWRIDDCFQLPAWDVVIEWAMTEYANKAAIRYKLDRFTKWKSK